MFIFFCSDTFSGLTDDNWKEIVDHRFKLLRKRDQLLKKRQALISKGSPLVSLIDLDTTKSEHVSLYNKAHDQFKRFAQNQGQFNVLKIQKVENIDTKIRFVTCLSHLWKPTYTKPLFHGSDPSTIQIISKEGFRFGSRNTGLFGGGIYFATDSVKSHGYTKNGGQMLICIVGVGQVHHATSHMQTALPETLKHSSDTIFGPRKVANNAYGLAYDEWVL